MLIVIVLNNNPKTYEKSDLMMGLGHQRRGGAHNRNQSVCICVRVATQPWAHECLRARNLRKTKRIKRKIKKKKQTRIESSQLRALHTVCDVI